MIRKEDGTVKLLVYRKKTHTDQYLNFTFHHALHRKLGVIKTLLERCGHPSWTIKKVKEQHSQKETTKEKKDKNTKKSKDMVTLPHAKGVTEPIKRIVRHQETATSVRPHQNIRRILMHPKDKVEDSKKADCVYQIPCKSCNHTYIGETGKTFGTRLEEHKKAVENITTRRFTREQKRVSAVTEHKSAITDHVERNNSIIDWERAKV